ncbi:hypothetical protein HOY80DRAFT_1018365, partial [Tuber brumale]
MSSTRSDFRNIHFYDATKPSGDALGGLIQNGSVTEANILHMIGIILVTEGPIRVQHRTSGHIVSETKNPLPIGTYDIYCDRPIQLSDEPWVHRIISHSVSGGEVAFREGIRARDGGCVISGVLNRSAPARWTAFEAAHIFPLEKENLWIELDYGRWVTDMDDVVVHKYFNQYLLSVNPDDNYRIVVFDNDMYGAGEPVLEDDFPPGLDIIGEIRGGEGMEVAARLRALP